MRKHRILYFVDTPVAHVDFDENGPISYELVEHNESYAPSIGPNSGLEGFKEWLEQRIPPNDRPHMSEVLDRYGIASTLALPSVCHNNSLSDMYWFTDEEELRILPMGVTGLRADDYWMYIDFCRKGRWSCSGQAMFRDNMKYFDDLNCPDFATSGSAPKTWVPYLGKIYLLKEDVSGGFGAFKEVAAAAIAESMGVKCPKTRFSTARGKMSVVSEHVLFYKNLPCSRPMLLTSWQVCSPMEIGYTSVYKMRPEELDIDKFYSAINRMLVFDYIIANVRSRKEIGYEVDGYDFDRKWYGYSAVYGNSHAFGTEENGYTDKGLVSPVTHKTLEETMLASVGKSGLYDIDCIEINAKINRIADEMGFYSERRKMIIDETMKRAYRVKKELNEHPRECKLEYKTIAFGGMEYDIDRSAHGTLLSEPLYERNVREHIDVI